MLHKKITYVQIKHCPEIRNCFICKLKYLETYVYSDKIKKQTNTHKTKSPNQPKPKKIPLPCPVYQQVKEKVQANANDP